MDMNTARNEETGQFTEKYQPIDFLSALRTLEGAAGTAAVAEQVGCPQRTAYHHLDALATDGPVAREKIGGTLLWSLSEEGESA